MPKMVQVPLPLSMVTVALVTPPVTLELPSEQMDVLFESIDSVTVSPEVDCAATGNVLPYAALAGAGVENVIV